MEFISELSGNKTQIRRCCRLGRMSDRVKPVPVAKASPEAALGCLIRVKVGVFQKILRSGAGFCSKEGQHF